MEDKLLVQGTVLLITSLAGIVFSLIVYIWLSSRRDDNNTIIDIKEDISDLFESRNEHRDRITKLETVCNTINCLPGTNKTRGKK